MKPIALLLLVLSATAGATERRAVVERRPVVRTAVATPVKRATVTVQPGFPVRRAPVSAYRPWPVHSWRVATRVFLPVVIFAPILTDAGATGAVWQQGVDLEQPNDWTEADFELPPSGGELLLWLDARAEIDFVEMTFIDGATQVVDFGREVRQPGTYELAQVDPSRPIDHLRVVARATDAAAGLTLELTP